MKLKLKEDAREWIKFATVWCIFIAAVVSALAFTDKLSWGVAGGTWAALGILMAIAFAKPRLVRPIYRSVMTASFHVGQVVGKILLTVFYLLVLTPIALLLRLISKDPLELQPQKTESYWKTTKSGQRLDRLF